MLLTETSMPRKSSKRRWYSRDARVGADVRPGVGPGLRRRHHVVVRDQRAQPIPVPAIEAVERLVDEMDILDVPLFTCHIARLVRLRATDCASRTSMGPIEVFTLTDGGQSADDVARRVAGFLHPAKSTLELALYDVRLPDPTGSIVADELRAASERGVADAAPLQRRLRAGPPSSTLHPAPVPRSSPSCRSTRARCRGSRT